MLFLSVYPSNTASACVERVAINKKMALMAIDTLQVTEVIELFADTHQTRSGVNHNLSAGISLEANGHFITQHVAGALRTSEVFCSLSKINLIVSFLRHA